MGRAKEVFLSSPSRIYCFADTVEMGRKLFEAGARVIQLRNKTADDMTFKKIAKEIQSLQRMYPDTVFIINDRVDIALEIGADGVHVGQEDEDFRVVRERLPDDMIVGVSARYPHLAAEVEKAGATYVGAGAVFPTPTKPDAAVIGIDGLRAVVEAVRIPVVAIGGITAQNVRDVCRLGVRYAAVISDINAAPDVAAAFRRLVELSED